MKDAIQIEEAIRSLPYAERKRVVFSAWASLENDPAFGTDPNVDPDGVALALARDAEVESGAVSAISHEEFLRQTGATVG